MLPDRESELIELRIHGAVVVQAARLLLADLILKRCSLPMLIRYKRIKPEV